jgi:hypothetical protein
VPPWIAEPRPRTSRCARGGRTRAARAAARWSWQGAQRGEVFVNGVDLDGRPPGRLRESNRILGAPVKVRISPGMYDVRLLMSFRELCDCSSVAEGHGRERDVEMATGHALGRKVEPERHAFEWGSQSPHPLVRARCRSACCGLRHAWNRARAPVHTSAGHARGDWRHRREVRARTSIAPIGRDGRFLPRRRCGGVGHQSLEA